MKTFRKYQRIIAVALLLLFAFITTPATLWHHHSTGIFTLDFSGAEKSPKIIEGTGAPVCAVCLHKYTTYESVSFCAIKPKPFRIVILEDRYHQDISSIYPPAFSNKGPPFLMS